MTGTIEVTCSSCKETSDYELNEQEAIDFLRYQVYGAAKVGLIQNLLPNVPAWIRSGVTTGFCICPKCCP